MTARRTRKSSIQLNYNHLHYFHVAAMEGSVGGAAQHLGVTQPTISEQLRTLERSLGVVLFERQSSGLKLTEAGRLTFKHTSVMFNAGERLAEELDRGTLRTPNALRVGVVGSIARLATPNLLTPLLGIQDCLPSVRVAEFWELFRELRDGSLDMMLSDTEPPKSERKGIDVILLQHADLAVVCAPGFTPSPTWDNVELLHYRVGTQLRWDVEAYVTERSLKPRIAAEADDPWLLIEAIGGNHVAIVPRTLITDALRSHRLRELDTLRSSHLGIYAVYRATCDLMRTAVERLSGQLRDVPAK